MRMLVVEDDFVSRRLLCAFLAPYGVCDVAVDGKEAVQAFEMALDQDDQYDLICLDIMMPNMNGQEALAKIRELERKKGILTGSGTTIVMTTALDDSKNVMQAFKEECDAYLIKPIDKDKLLAELSKLKLIAPSEV